MQTNGQSTLGFLVADASRLLRRRLQQESRDLPMTAAQLKIVARLARNEGTGQAALAALLDLEPMTLSRHVDRMEAAGLVERRADPHDRRARQLFTTPKSRELLQPMRARADAVYDLALAGMCEAERQALNEGLATIIANLCAAETDSGAAAEETTRLDRPTAKRKSA